MFDPRRGTFDQPETDDEREQREIWIAEQLRDYPCYCLANPDQHPHWHAPQAYPGIDRATGTLIYLGG